MNTSKSLDLDSIFAEVGRIYRTERLTQLDLEKLDNMKAAIVEAVEGLVQHQAETLCYFDQEDAEHKELGVLIPVKSLLQAIKEWQ